MTLLQPHWSVRTQLLLLVLVFVLPGSVMLTMLFANDWRRASDQAHTRIRLLADGVASRLADELQQREALLRRIAERPLVRALDPARCDPLIAEYIGLHPEFTGLDLRDLAANAICSYRPNAPAAAHVVGLPWFQEAARGTGFGLSGAFPGSRTGRWVSVLSYPIRDDGGKPAGLVLLAVDLLELERRVSGPLPEGAVVAAVDRAGNVVLRSHQPEQLLGKPGPARDIEEARRRGTGFLTGMGVDGVRRLYAFAAVPGAGWVVVAGLPEAELFAEQRAGLAWTLGVGIALLGVMGLLARRIARTVVEPIHGLAGVAERVAGGDRTARAQLSGPAEIGAVAQQFNRMLDVRDRADEQRATAVQALRERERFVSALMGNLPGMVYRCRNDPHWTMLFVSEGCKSLTGFEPSQLEGNREVSYASLVHPDDRDAVWQGFEALRGTPGARKYEYRIIAKDGGVRWVWEHATGVYDGDGSLLSIEGFIQDITERRRAESELEQSQDQYRSIVENALDAVVQIDASGRITGWNECAVSMFGWRAAEAIGRELAETLIPLRHRDAHRRGLARFLAGGEGPVLGRVIEIEALHRGGHEFPIELAVTALRSTGEYGFNAFIRDITRRRNAQAERGALEMQLREAQKMEAIGTLAGGIAHDFNNILGSILGNVALAREYLEPADEANAHLEQVHKAALRARGLVQQMLAYSRRQPQQLATRPLAPLVRETVEMLRAILPAGVALEIAAEDASLHAMCDASQIQQVVMNLCTNAWQAIAEGRGRIEVGLEPATFDHDDPRPAGLAVLAHGPCVHLWVSDDGTGIDEATRSRMFEPFYTTKPVGQGTGLGLSVVHGIVKAHAGAIVVDSEPGKGSTFHIYLPRAAPAVDTEPIVPGALDGPLGSGEHVLCIDDDEVMLLMVQSLLVRHGYRVTAYSDPLQAVAAAHSQAAFDIVVTDFNMPQFSGLDVARELASLRPGLPVVLSSGHVTDALREQALLAGACAVLHKENSVDELAPLLRRMLAQARDHD